MDLLYSSLIMNIKRGLHWRCHKPPWDMTGKDNHPTQKSTPKTFLLELKDISRCHWPEVINFIWMSTKEPLWNWMNKRLSTIMELTWRKDKDLPLGDKKLKVKKSKWMPDNCTGSRFTITILNTLSMLTRRHLIWNCLGQVINSQNKWSQILNSFPNSDNHLFKSMTTNNLGPI